MKFLPFAAVLALFTASLWSQQATPEKALKPAGIFGDHMVLQQGKPTRVFGTGPASSDLMLAFAGQKIDSKIAENGEWEVELKPLKTNATGQTLTLSAGGESVEIKDILVGEVWMCSGQSNMAMSLNRTENADDAAARADHPNLRLFTTSAATATSPQRDIVNGEWKICTPQSAPTFSAVGYFFGAELLKNLNTPIGLVSTAWGGKPSEAFTSRETLEETPSAARLLAEWDDKQKTYNPEAAKDRYTRGLAAWEKRMEDFRAAKKRGEKPDAKKVGKKPTPPQAPHLQPNAPSAIYNQMIAPWNPYAIAGAIWYQGESNRHRAVQYETLFPAMITDWRKQRGDDFPFYIVQLANFLEPSTEPGTPSSWAELQNAQTLTLQKIPNTGLAIINDIGEAKDIHPRNKQDVGKRLSRWALSEHYNQPLDGPVSGPIYKSHEVVDNTIRVEFDHVGNGLKSRDGEDLKRFEIAGDDQKWVWAEATITDAGNSVTISSPGIDKPVAARYAWAANPEGANLVNSSGLPASLFRTDDWELSTAGVESLGEVSARTALANLPAQHEKLRQAGWEILFNGKDLTGWQNPYNYGDSVVKNGEIHLSSNKKFFLVTEKKYSDFTLVAEIKLPEGKANSGIMFRAHVEPGKVYGYQAECDGSDRRWSGGLYDEGRRRWIWPSKKGSSEEQFLKYSEKSLAHLAKPEVAGALKRNDWNKYLISCKGDRITIKLNGVAITNVRDSVDSEGHIGIQHHGEEGAVYKFRNIYLKPQ